MRERVERHLLRHPGTEGAFVALLALAIGLPLGLALNDYASSWIVYIVATAVGLPLQRHLRRRRQAEWRELGLPDPMIDPEVAAGNPPLVNAYPLTAAARRRRWIYAGLAAGCAAVVVPLALLHTGAWAGVLATVAMLVAGLAGVVVLARGLRAER
jgi:hypothetical protein